MFLKKIFFLPFFLCCMVLQAQISYEAQGTVIPCRLLKVKPEVSGQVVMMSSEMVLGGLVKEGDLLLQIDPRDYDVVIAQEQAQVAKAEFECKSEQARKTVAQREWELLELSEECSDLGRELALREPHQKEKQAALDAAICRLDKAHYNRERTSLYAPFNGLVTEENIELGQVLSPQTAVATIVATDCFWISAAIPLNWLEWVRFQTVQGSGTPVEIKQTLENGRVIIRQGYVLRSLGCADPKTNLAQILVQVDDPLGLQDPQQRIPLLLNSQVKLAFLSESVKK